MYRIRDANDDDPDTQYVISVVPTERAWGRRAHALRFTASDAVAFVAAPPPRRFDPYQLIIEPADE